MGTTTTTLNYEVKDWIEKGCRHVFLKANLRVMPYVRQTRTTRWRNNGSGERAKAYNDARGTIRDVVAWIMKTERLPQFRDVKLGFASSFWLRPKQTFGMRRHGTIDNPNKIDLSNLEKSLEDSLQGVLIPNDMYIWVRGAGAKHLASEDGFEVHVWELFQPIKKE